MGLSILGLDCTCGAFPPLRPPLHRQSSSWRWRTSINPRPHSRTSRPHLLSLSLSPSLLLLRAAFSALLRTGRQAPVLRKVPAPPKTDITTCCIACCGFASPCLPQHQRTTRHHSREHPGIQEHLHLATRQPETATITSCHPPAHSCHCYMVWLLHSFCLIIQTTPSMPKCSRPATTTGHSVSLTTTTASTFHRLCNEIAPLRSRKLTSST